jgi:hypothetical protein
MADEDKNLYQEIVKTSRDFLDVFIRLGGDPLARREVLLNLGLDPNTPGLPPVNPASVSNIDKFINLEASKADEIAFASVLIDLSQLSLSIRTFYEAANTAGDLPLAADNLAASMFGIMLQDYFRLRAPVFYKLMGAIQFGTQESLFDTGFADFFERLGSFFKKFGGIKNENEKDARDFSDVSFFLVAAGLTYLDEKFLWRTPFSIEAAYGYDFSSKTLSPQADGLSARFLTLSFKNQTSEILSETIYISIAMIPPEQGGPAWIFDVNGKITVEIDNVGGWKLKLEGGGGGIFRTDSPPEPSTAAFFEFNFKKEISSARTINLSALTLGFQKQEIGLLINTQEMDVKFGFDLIIKTEPEKLKKGFWRTIMPKLDEKPRIAFGISTMRGLHFGDDEAGFHFQKYINVYKGFSIGPFKISLDRILVGLAKLKDSDDFEAEVSVDLMLKIGDTVVITVTRIGITQPLKKDDDFPLKYKPTWPEFRPPTGLGISIKVPGVITGGGYLFFDPERGEYGGAIELKIDAIQMSIKAIGLFSTKFPDGEEGVSFIVLATVELPIAIELSFNFMIKGFGIIVGTNRILNPSAIADGVRTNALQSILFPEDVVANIHRIISDLQQFFPVRRDYFVIGLMIRMGWGGTAQKTLVDLQLGVLVSFSTTEKEITIAIVGILTIGLPDEKLALLRIQVNFAGILDPGDNGYFFFRADIFNSRLLVYTLTGSMAVIVGWGNNAAVAYSSGGFHPDFTDIPRVPSLPNAFDNMARLGIRLLSGSNPRVSLEAYFAITSNSAQLGAKAELFAAAGGFNVYGYLGFDALFIFKPLHFEVAIYAGMALRRGSRVVCGISLNGKLSGPNPWHVNGSASITILFFDISVGFEKTWGDPPEAVESETEDLQLMMQNALAEDRNWIAELPPYHSLNVSLRNANQPTGDLVIHPAGVLKFSQVNLPLGFELQKYGNKKPKDVNRFDLSGAESRGITLSADYNSITEPFARNQYFELDDHAKLTNKSYEPLRSGFELSGTAALKTGTPVSKEVEYELSYLNQERLEFHDRIRVRCVTKIYDTLVQGSAVRQSVLSLQRNRPSLVVAKDAVITKDQFAIASTIDLTSHLLDGEARPVLFSSQSEALQTYNALLREQPALASKLQVVHHMDLAGA